MTDDLDYTLSCLRRSAKEDFAWTLYPAGAAALVGEVERLRAERDHFRRAWSAAQVRLDCGTDATEAVREERAAVLRWLRRGDANVYPSWVALADEIERGEHRREEEK